MDNPLLSPEAGNPMRDYLEESVVPRDTPVIDGIMNTLSANTMVPFYPNRKYVEKNWQPEMYPLSAIGSIARAQALAQKTGVLPAEHGKYFFPTQLVENRPFNFGLSDALRLKDGKNPYEELAQKMQLAPPSDVQDPIIQKIVAMTKAAGGDPVPQLAYRAASPDSATSPTEAAILQDDNAKLAAAFYSTKTRNRTPEQAAEAWNGKGRVTTWAGIPVYGGKVIADSSNHLRKVKEMAEMMNHPANAGLKAVWDKAFADALAGK